MPPIYYGSAPFALKRGSQALNLYYGSTLISGGSSSIGGVAIGDSGTGIYSGYVLSDGDDFNSLSLVSASTPTADYFTTRVYRGPGGPNPSTGLRAPPDGPLAVSHDVSPDYTGWQDSGRGVALNLDSHTISGGSLRLKSIRQTAGEQTKLATGVAAQIERSAMIHTAGRLWWNSPAIIEWYATLPPGPAGQHPTLWTLAMQPPGGIKTGYEYGFEGNGVSTEAYDATWDTGVLTGVNHGGATSAWRDGLPHKFTVICSPTERKFYVDDVLVMTGYYDPDTLGGNQADYALITNHIVNSTWFGETYSASAWAADADGVVMDIHWLRCWRPAAGTHYAPLAAIPDTSITHGAVSTIVLPSQMSLWGASGLTEYVCAIPNEEEEPGGAFNTSYNQFPTGVTYDSGTRTVSIANTLVGSGCLHFAVGVSQDGVTCKPARFRLYVAPRWIGPSPFAWSVGVPADTDIYAGWDVGRLFRTTGDPKALTMTGLPAGLSFDANTGLLTGTPSSASSGSVTLTCTNNQGQTTSTNVSYSISAVADGTPAPALTGSPTLLASWDFDNATTLTIQDTDRITSISGSDGTAHTLASVTTQRPILYPRSGKNTARFYSAESRYLRIASDLGVTGACTMVAIYEPYDVATTICIADLAKGTAAFSADRRMLLASTTTGYQARKHDAANTQTSAASGSPYTTALKLVVGRFAAGASSISRLNVDGQGTAVSGSPVSNQPATPTHFTLGADTFSGGLERFANGHLFRVLVYGSELSDAQCEEVAVWAATNYGTTNNA